MDIHDYVPETKNRKPTTDDYILYGRRLRAEYFAQLLGRAHKKVSNIMKNMANPVRRRLAHG